ncbi:hypothetical protein C8F01DRAFT_1111580, partial [Mycena amicta]
QSSLEISSNILALCGTGLRSPNFSQPPLVFLRVCRGWRMVAFSTPSLWSALKISSPLATTFEHCFEAWIGHVRMLLLSLLFEGTIHPRVLTVVKRHSHRVQNLDLRNFYPSEGVQSLTKTFIRLRKLSIAFTSDLNRDAECGQLTLGLLAASRDSLVELELRGWAPRRRDDAESSAFPVVPLLLPNLQNLHFTDIDGQSVFACCDLLLSVTLPALQELVIRCFTISPEQLGDFISRSSPPLQHLILDLPAILSDIIPAYFSSLTSLSDLTIKWDDSADNRTPFMDLLATPTFLPNLRALTVFGPRFLRTEAHYEALTRALTLRSPSLRNFRLFWPSLEGIDYYTPSMDAGRRMLPLVQAGMHIFVGRVGGKPHFDWEKLGAVAAVDSESD